MNDEIVPSYFAKVQWAEKHVVDLERLINEWIASHPYGTRRCVENQKDVWRITVNQPTNSQIPVVAGNIIYSLHSALDHLACVLVPSASRSSVSFPIFWEGVWETPREFDWNLPIPFENSERGKDRARWNTITRNMSPEAVAILEKLQPTDVGENLVNSLRIIKALANKDRHSEFPRISGGLQCLTFRFTLANGGQTLSEAKDTFASDALVRHDAQIQTPPDTVDVDVVATPIIAVRFPQEKSDHNLLGLVRDRIPDVRKILNALSPHVHVPRT